MRKQLWTWWLTLALGCSQAGGRDGPPGPQGPPGEGGPPGAVGATGPTGADGQLRIYGNASGGAKTISASGSLDDVNLQFTDFRVNAGVTLTVPSGTVIRCVGSFTNEGMISVEPFARGGIYHTQGRTLPIHQAAHPGIAPRAAVEGYFSDAADSPAFGGPGALGLTVASARRLLQPGPAGGGGGAGTDSAQGGAGGGTLTVLCRGPVVNAGTIAAAGTSGLGTGTGGAGGGGGGVIILASATSVTNSGVIIVQGGNGSPGAVQPAQALGGGGGGGGGIIHLLAPSISAGTTNIVGGLGAPSPGVALVTDRRGSGGGGGGGGGAGGTGGGVEAGAVPVSAGQDGSPGKLLLSDLDPTALF